MKAPIASYSRAQGGQVHRRHLSISLRDSHVTWFNRQIVGNFKWNIARRNIYTTGSREIVFLFLSIISVFHQREKYCVTIQYFRVNFTSRIWWQPNGAKINLRYTNCKPPIIKLTLWVFTLLFIFLWMVQIKICWLRNIWTKYKTYTSMYNVRRQIHYITVKLNDRLVHLSKPYQNKG